MNRCCNGGSLVNAATPFPDDVGDYYAHPSFGLIGCNRLYCRRCQSFVRSAPGIGFAAPDMTVDLGAIYDRPELLGGPEIMATHGDRRLYLCRCSRWLEAFTRPVIVDEPDPLTDPTMPWSCAGHPDVLFPADIDGVFLRSAAEVEPLAQRALAGFAGPEARPKEAAAWTARLYARFQGTPTADAIARCAADALADPDPAVRGRAVRFFFIFPLAVGVSRIVAVLEGDRAGFAGVPTEPWEWRDNRTLEESLWWVASQFVARNERVRELARREVRTPGHGRAVLLAVVQHDGAWLVDHVDEIVRANPDSVADLLDVGWQNHDDPRALLRRVAALREVSPEILATFAERQRLRREDRELIAAHIARRTPQA